MGVDMHSTMQDFPLTVTSILRHGTGWNSSRRVTTATAHGYREISYGELGTRVGQLAHGLRHYEAGRISEALWWWQFSYLSDWGERASSVLRTLQAILAHLRLDVEDDVAAEAEYDALQP